jgi:small subunit ribosomal protein S14
MAKVSSIQKNLRRKKMTKTYSARRAKLKSVVMSKTSSLEERMDAQMRLAKLPRNSAKVRIRNRCELTGRPRGYHRKFGLSRNMLRQLALAGQLPGVVKLSW